MPQDVTRVLLGSGLRAEVDAGEQKIGYKIREHTLLRIPFLLVAGISEANSEQVAIRTMDGQNLGVLHITDALDLLVKVTRAADLDARDVAQLGLPGRMSTIDGNDTPPGTRELNP